MNVKLREVWKRILKDVREFKWGIVLFTMYYLTSHLILKAFCPLVIVTGFPCPACGMTRAIQFMITGQLVRSFQANPMALPWIIFGLYFVLMRYVFGKKVKWFYEVLGVIIVLMLIIYIIRMKTTFPYRPPMSYTRGNVFEYLVPFYKEMLRKAFDVW